jgi:hypothetical protein
MWCLHQDKGQDALEEEHDQQDQQNRNGGLNEGVLSEGVLNEQERGVRYSFE